MNNPCQNSGSFEHRSSLLLHGAPQPRCKTRSVGAVCTPRSPAVLQVLHLRAPSSGASGCNTVSYEFISLVGHEELRNNFTLSPWPCFSAESRPNRTRCGGSSTKGDHASSLRFAGPDHPDSESRTVLLIHYHH